ncbi:MAG: hypothetical protein ACKOPM_09600 [Novosphingobium sp.]
MAEINSVTEVELYDIMSKLASRAALDSATKTIALIQKVMAENPKDGSIHNMAGPGVLTDDEAAKLGAYEPDVLNKAWRKLIRTVDIAIEFVPELDRLARTEGILLRPGDKVTGMDPMGFAGIAANWEVEINLGVIRGKVSW